MVCMSTLYILMAHNYRRNGWEITSYDWDLHADDTLWEENSMVFGDVENELKGIVWLYPITCPFHKYLKAVLNITPHFLRCGGILGFPCEHAYDFNERDITTITCMGRSTYSRCNAWSPDGDISKVQKVDKFYKASMSDTDMIEVNYRRDMLVTMHLEIIH